MRSRDLYFIFYIFSGTQGAQAYTQTFQVLFKFSITMLGDATDDNVRAIQAFNDTVAQIPNDFLPY